MRRDLDEAVAARVASGMSWLVLSGFLSSAVDAPLDTDPHGFARQTEALPEGLSIDEVADITVTNEKRVGYLTEDLKLIAGEPVLIELPKWKRACPSTHPRLEGHRGPVAGGRPRARNRRGPVDR
ncbi:MAG: hypothetical protein JRI25_09535 [Deltaproteobacteria bacterium]|nr:hypothetical protein [Deltaproteobacteria bacterium]